ncbi:4-hydroxythreonine-4-phosphate dehydrogenase PdxA [bacterium]|nr:4-hydroxythreonine-4-phosphate dehydrogenase PdxA [bacterium]
MRDVLFVKYNNFDCIIANYHDQGLIPIKTVAGNKTVNMTIGLDVIRTSPGHGTAFDIAGKNIANETSMVEAIKAVL